jgi:phthiocerol/phenolphthiocerol synthesis type-I polyketide synthase D
MTVPEPPPLFLFPGMGGYDPELVEVGYACGDAVTTVQVAYPAWRVLHDMRDFDFETLVNDVVGQIMRHRPACAILLAGYSFGSIVAFAAAARLRDIGYSVRFLGLLDSEAHPGLDTAPGALRAPKTRWQQLAGFTASMPRGDAQSKLAYVTARHLKSPRWRPLLRIYARIPRRWLKGTFRIYLERDLLSEHMEPLLLQWVARRGAVRPLPVPAYLFRTDQHSGNAPHHLGWDDYCPDLTVVSIPGSHLGMLGSSNRPILCTAFRNAVVQALGRAVPQ